MALMTFCPYLVGLHSRFIKAWQEMTFIKYLYYVLTVFYVLLVSETTEKYHYRTRTAFTSTKRNA